MVASSVVAMWKRTWDMEDDNDEDDDDAEDVEDDLTVA